MATCWLEKHAHYSITLFRMKDDFLVTVLFPPSTLDYFCFHLLEYVSRMTIQSDLLSTIYADWQAHTHIQNVLTWDFQLKPKTSLDSENDETHCYILGTRIEHPQSFYPFLTFHCWPDTRRQENARQLRTTGWVCHGRKLQVVREKEGDYRVVYPYWVAFLICY